MLFNVLAEHTERCTTTTEHTIRPTPQHRLTVPLRQCWTIGFTEQPGGDSFDVVDKGGHEHRRRQFDQEMHMIGFAIAFQQCSSPLLEQSRKGPHEVFAHGRC